MPLNQQGNVPQNNDEQLDGQQPENPQGPEGEENIQPEDAPVDANGVPENDPAQMGLEGEQLNPPGYVPPAPPEEAPQEEDEFAENLNINQELEARENGQPAQQPNINNRVPNPNYHEEEAPQGSYIQHFMGLKQAVYNDKNVADMIATAILMQRDPRERFNKEAVDELAAKILNQPAFERLMSDPKAKQLKENGNGVGLIEMLAAKENERKAEQDQYIRPEEFAYEDSLFLREAIDKLQKKEGTPGAGAAGKSRKNKRFREMIKQLEHAESLTEKGIQLSGDDTKKLIDAVKKYNDGGSAVPGGTKRAAGATEAMCILKRYMPAGEYKMYCDRINARLKKKIDPESFSEKRLYEQELSVSEMKKQCRQNLQKEFTLENCAALVACATTKPKNGLIDAEEYEKQKARLLEDGSAFKKALMDKDVQKKIFDMADQGEKANKIIGEISSSAMGLAGKSSQWYFNRSRGALLNGRVNTYFAGEHLANIMALHQFSLTAEMGDKVTSQSFAERAEVIRQDPVFKRMADRYALDPEYRRHINGKLREDGTGASLTEEYGRVQRSMHRRKAQPEQQEQQQQPHVGA